MTNKNAYEIADSIRRRMFPKSNEDSSCSTISLIEAIREGILLGRLEGAREQRESILEAFSVLSDLYAQKGMNDVCDNIRRQIQTIRAQGEGEGE